MSRPNQKHQVNHEESFADSSQLNTQSVDVRSDHSMRDESVATSEKNANQSAKPGKYEEAKQSE